MGYTYPGSADPCTPGVSTFFKDASSLGDYARVEARAVSLFSARWGIDAPTARLLQDCGCLPGSPRGDSAKGRCSSLDAVRGSWMHADPESGERLICDEGPLLFAMRALAVLKSSPLLPLHPHDTIAPVNCSSLGFPYIYPPRDHCFNTTEQTLHVWTRTENIAQDPGCAKAVQVEDQLTKKGGFLSWAQQQGLRDTAMLNNAPECNCLPGTTVYAYCGKGASSKHSPVRDWWSGDTPRAASQLLVAA